MRRTALALAVAAAFATPPAHAQVPTGGQVIAGGVTLPATGATQQVITQSTNRAIIQWDSFSIGAGNSVHFSQPGRSSVILNRVKDGGPRSEIFGQLSANGQVFLVNPKGIYFAPGAQVDVGALVASTLAIRDSDFLSGNYRFAQVGAGETAAQVINEGVIRAREGGYVVLAGDYVANRGVVEARLGTVLLGSANALTLDVVGDSLINYSVDERNLTQLAGVANSGELLADGGRVVMTASTARNLTTATVNNSGVIQARGTEERNGAVYLLADAGNIALESGSLIDVSGSTTGGGGGTVLVGGNFHGAGPEVNAAKVHVADGARINADANGRGDGGKVAIWSDQSTHFAGQISARGGAQGGNGGLVEVSGKQQLGFVGSVDTTAAQGKAGTLLLDPADITISNAADVDITASSIFSDLTDNGGVSNLSVATLQAALAGGNVIVSTGTTAGGNAGNITVVDPLTWATAFNLQLSANNLISINAAVTASNGSLSLFAGSGAGATQSAAGVLTLARLNLAGDGPYNFTAASNAVTTLATVNAHVNGALSFRNTGALVLDGVQSVGAMTLNVGGALTQTGAIVAPSLNLTGAGSSTLNRSDNSVAALSGAISATDFRTSGALSVGAINSAGGAISLHSGGLMTLNGSLTAGAADIALTTGAGITQAAGNLTGSTLTLGGSGTFTLNSGGNDFTTLTGSTGGGALDFRDANALILGALNTGGNAFKLTVNGALTQSGALSTGSLELISASGASTLTNAGNSITYLAAATHGSFTLNNTSSELYTQVVGGTTGVNTSNNNFTLFNTNTLVLGNGASNGTLNVGTATAELHSNRIVQNGTAPIVANNLALITTNYVGLSGSTNSVSNLGFSATGAGGGAFGQSLDFANDRSLTITNVAGVVGLTTQNAHAKIYTTGNITVDENVNTGSGHLALLAHGGTVTVNAGNTVTAAALAIETNATTLDPSKFIFSSLAGQFSGNFTYAAPADLTIADNIWGINGITAGGNIALSTPTAMRVAGDLIAGGDIQLVGGTFGADGSIPAFSSALALSSYRDAATGRYRAGLMLEGTIKAANGGGQVALHSDSGVFQWATDIGPPPVTRANSKILSRNLVVSGTGAFDLQSTENQLVGTSDGSGDLAANVTGTFSFATKSPLDIWEIYDPYSATTVVGIHAAQLGTNGPSISLVGSRADAGRAMAIFRDISIDRATGGTITLNIGAGDEHSKISTLSGAKVRGASLLLGAPDKKGEYELTTDVSSLAAAGGFLTRVDNSAYTGRLDVLGLGSSLSGGTPTPVGDFYLTTGGEMLVLGGKSGGDFLQLRANQLTMFGTMEMKDGARVLLQPYNLTNWVGIHNQFDRLGFTMQTNYARSVFQAFSPTATFYVGSTPALMNQDANVPSQVKNLNLSGEIHIASDGDNGMKMGYKSLSAETTSKIVAYPMGDIFNLRLAAPTVNLHGFNATGNQIHLIADNLNLLGTASAYGIPNAQNNAVTLQPWTTRSIWLGFIEPAYSSEMFYSWDTLDKLSKNSQHTLIISGTTDKAYTGSYLRLAHATLGPSPRETHYHPLASKLILSSTGYIDTSLTPGTFGLGFTLKDWNSASSTYPLVDRVETGATGYVALWTPNASRNNYSTGYSTPGTLYGYGKAGGTWGGCANLATCTGSNPSPPTPPFVPGLPPGYTPGSTPGFTPGDPPSGPPPPPPAPPPQTPVVPPATPVPPPPGWVPPTPPGTPPTSGIPEGGPPGDFDPTTFMTGGGPGGPGPGGPDGPGGPIGGGPGGPNTGGPGGPIGGGPGGPDGGGGGPGGPDGGGGGPGGPGGPDVNGPGNTGPGTGGPDTGGTGGDGPGTSGTDTSGTGNSGPGTGGPNDGDGGSGSGRGGDGSGDGGGGSGRSGDGSGDDGGGSGRGGDGSGDDGGGSGRGGDGSGDDGGGSGRGGDGSGDDGGGSGRGGDGSGDDSGGSGRGGDGSGDDSGGSGRGGDGSGDDGGGSGRSGDGSGDDSGGSGRSGDGSGDDGGGSGRSGDGSGDDGGGSGRSGDGSGDDGSGSGRSGDGSGDDSGGSRRSSDGSESGDGSGRSVESGQGSDEGEGGTGRSGSGDDESGSGRSDGKDDAQGGSGRKEDGAGDGEGRFAAGNQSLCVGEVSADRTQELPEQAGSLADKPLVDTRNGGINLDSPCARQSVSVGGAAGSVR